jgi:putative transcriptional regulator
MSEAHESLMDGLNEALAFARGERTGAVIHQVAVPAVDVATIQASTDERPHDEQAKL